MRAMVTDRDAQFKTVLQVLSILCLFWQTLVRCMLRNMAG
jgi:hypothetical protein